MPTANMASLTTTCPSFPNERKQGTRCGCALSRSTSIAPKATVAAKLIGQPTCAPEGRGRSWIPSTYAAGPEGYEAHNDRLGAGAGRGDRPGGGGNYLAFTDAAKQRYRPSAHALPPPRRAF